MDQKVGKGSKIAIVLETQIKLDMTEPDRSVNFNCSKNEENGLKK